MIEECEECGYKERLVDAIISGEIKRICNRCVVANNAIVIRKPKTVDMRDIEHIERRSVHDILMKMAGLEKLKPIKKPPAEITLEDLRERYEKIKQAKKILQEREGAEKIEEVKKVAEVIEHVEEKPEIKEAARGELREEIKEKVGEILRPEEKKEEDFLRQLEKAQPDKKEFLEIPEQIKGAYEELKEKREEERGINFSLEATKRMKVADLVAMKKQQEAKEIQQERQQETREETKQTNETGGRAEKEEIKEETVGENI